jgi:PAS domain S-box-containing protein
MDLRRKASLVVLLMTLSIILALLGLSDRTMLRGFLQIEAGTVRDRMAHLGTVLHREAETLAAFVRDYAVWDKTTSYLEGTNPTFAEVHLSSATFDQIDGFFIFDPGLEPRIALSRDAQRSVVKAAQDDVARAARLAASAIESTQGTAVARSVRDNRLVMAAACAVRPTSGQGKARGAVVQTRSFSVADLDTLLHSVDLQISVHAPDEEGPEDLAEAAERLSDRMPTWSMPRDDNTIAGYLLLTGSGGATEGILRVKAARLLITHGRRSLHVFLAALVATCALFGIPAAWLVDRLVRTGLSQREGEERFRAVTESARDAILAVRNDRIVSWNRGARRIFGHDPGEILGRSPSLLFPPEPHDAPSEGLNAIRAPATDPMLGVPREIRALRKDGQEFPAEVSVGAWHTGDGEFRSVILRDITDRRSNEAALRASETKYRIISDHTSDWELWTAPDGRLLYSSPSCEQITGRPVHAFLDDPSLLRSIVHPDDLPLFVGHCGRDGGSDRSGEVEFRILHRDGTVRWLAHTCLRVYDDEGTYLGIRTSNRDVTARRLAEEEKVRLEEQVRNAQKLESLGVLAGGIAHDFNNLLVGILGNVEMALDADLTPSVRESLDGIRNAGSRAADLVRQMLAYSGRTNVALRPIDISETLRASAPLLRAAISHRIDFGLELSQGLPLVKADPAQIRQVVMNLIANAAEAIGERTGTVRIGVRTVDAGPGFFEDASLTDNLAQGAYVAVEVSDDGPGIADEVLPKIFDPFFTTKFTGRGLGLPVVLGIMRAHRGSIRIRTSSDRGTTVTVYFPACDLPTPPSTPVLPAETPAWRGSGHVLVIDDESLVRDVATRMISRLGFDVLSAPDGVEGIRVFREHVGDIRAVVLDLTMPRMDGEATLREIRAVRADMPVILASGFSELDVAAVGRDDPRVYFLQKPFRLPLLIERLRRAVEGPQTAAGT